MKLRVALAQVNPTVGDLVANAALVRTNFKTAQDAGAHIVVFPEMVLTGYPVEDLALRPSFQLASQSALTELAGQLTGGCVAIVGYLDQVNGAPQNMVAVISDGSAVLGLGNIGPQAAIPVMHSHLSATGHSAMPLDEVQAQRA